MELKKEYTTSKIVRKVNGSLLVFDVKKTKISDYIYYYNNGFKDCFIEEIKTIEFKNSDTTPIKVTRKKTTKKGA